MVPSWAPVPLIYAGFATARGLVPYQVVTGSRVTVIGQTLPGATVVLTESGPGGSGTFQTRADAAGRFVFGLDVGFGNTFMTLQERPYAFGVTTVRIAVTRLDTAAPTVKLDGPTSLGSVNHDVTISGTAADVGAGVARVEVSQDGGPFRAVPVDARGRFSYRTTFAKDGETGGTHTVRFRAVDAAGNVSPAAAVSLAFDAVAPKVLFWPSGSFTGPVASLTLTYSEPMAASALDPANYTITLAPLSAPGGSPAAPSVVKVASVKKVAVTTYELVLASPLLPGSYTLAVGPKVADVAGNPVAGRTSSGLVVTAAVASVPAVPVPAAAGAPVTVEVVYREPMGASAFRASSYLVTDAPGGPSPGYPVLAVNEVSPTAAEVVLASLPAGVHDLVIGAGVASASGRVGGGPLVVPFLATDAPPVAAAMPSGPVGSAATSVDVVYSQAMGPSAFDRAGYTIQSDTGPFSSATGLVSFTVRELTPNIAELDFGSPPAAGSYTVQVSGSVADAAGRALLGDAQSGFRVDPGPAPKGGAPVLVSRPGLVQSPALTLDLTFDRPMGPGAFDPANYALGPLAATPAAPALTPAETIVSAREVSPSVVELTFASPLTAGLYELSLTGGVTSADGPPLAQRVYGFSAADPSAPRVQSVPFGLPPGTTTFDVVYSQPMGDLAFQASAYEVDPYPPTTETPIAAESVRKVDDRTAEVTLSRPLGVGAWTLRLAPNGPGPVTDANGRPVVGPGAIRLFSFAP